MAFVAQTYLRGQFDYVILSSVVLYAPWIVQRILERISGVEYELLHVCLICDKTDLVSRATKRDGVAKPDLRFLNETLQNQFLKLDTTGKTPLEVAESILVQAVTKHGSQNE